MTKYFISFLLYVFTVTVCPAQRLDSIAKSMFNKTRQIKTLTYKMNRRELYEGEIKEQSSFIKLQRNPFKVYSKQLAPEEGIEVLYKESEKTALINPNGFPWFNIRLDPFGSRMTRGQHHTIKDPGFDRFVNILKYLFEKYNDIIEEIASVTDLNENGREFWLLSFKNPHFKIIDYQVRENESIWDLCYRKQLSAYMILMLNDDMDDYGDFGERDRIKIPNDYSPEMSLKIDKHLLVPTEIKVYYNNSLFEHYNFDDININPDLAPEEFRADYHEYDF